MREFSGHEMPHLKLSMSSCLVDFVVPCDKGALILLFQYIHCISPFLDSYTILSFSSTDFCSEKIVSMYFRQNLELNGM